MKYNAGLPGAQRLPGEIHMKASGQDKWQAMFQAFYGWLCRMHRLPSLQTPCLFTGNSSSPSPGFLGYSYSLTVLHYLASF